MSKFWFLLDARERCPELLEQGATVTSKRRTTGVGAGEVTEVDNELPTEATSDGGRSLGEEGRKQHQSDDRTDEHGKRRVEKCRGIVGHHIVNVGYKGEVHGRQKA